MTPPVATVYVAGMYELLNTGVQENIDYLQWIPRHLFLLPTFSSHDGRTALGIERLISVMAEPNVSTLGNKIGRAHV